jgi:G:T-mismatch repair DNA endonuclease (very short patch repair protein)
MSDQDREDHYSKVFKNSGISKAEEDFFNVLIDNGINFERGKCVSGFFPDGVIEDEKLIIEFYGDSFHCNPNKFSDSDQYCSWIKRTVQQQWDRDKKRIAVFPKYGYKVLIVWESDWNSNQNDQIQRIKSFIGDLD